MKSSSFDSLFIPVVAKVGSRLRQFFPLMAASQILTNYSNGYEDRIVVISPIKSRRTRAAALPTHLIGEWTEAHNFYVVDSEFPITPASPLVSFFTEVRFQQRSGLHCTCRRRIRFLLMNTSSGTLLHLSVFTLRSCLATVVPCLHHFLLFCPLLLFIADSVWYHDA